MTYQLPPRAGAFPAGVPVATLKGEVEAVTSPDAPMIEITGSGPVAGEAAEIREAEQAEARRAVGESSGVAAAGARGRCGWRSGGLGCAGRTELASHLARAQDALAFSAGGASDHDAD
jgi:hypothetical protein